MAFLWPGMLWSLVLVPFLVAGYLRLTHPRDAAARVGSMRLTESASGRQVVSRRHVPAALFLVAVALLLVAVARPTVVLALPHREGTVILAFDVSTSMEADDLEPTRLDAAKEAASEFVRQQPSTIQIGVVAFGDTALVLQKPTNVESDVLAAIDRLATQGGTSVSAGMIGALSAITDRPIVTEADAPAARTTPVAGYFGSAVIVLLTDGEDTSRTDPSEVISLVSDAGVHVNSIGIGTPDGTTLEIDGYSVATALNEPLLREIASATGGKYFGAEDAAELKEIYDTVGRQLVVRGERTEVTALFAASAMLVLMIGSTLQVRWFGRAP